MSETLLNALVHLFAIAANIKNEILTPKGRDIVNLYLKRYLSQELINKFLILFDNYYNFYKSDLTNSNKSSIRKESIISIQIEKVCRQIKKGLLREERVIVFLQLLEFVYEEDITNEEIEFVKTVAKTFSFSDHEFQNFNSFIADGDPELLEKDKVLVIDNQLREWSGNVAWIMKKKEQQSTTVYKYIYRENLYGKIIVLYIQSIESFVFRYFGELNLYL